MQFDSVILEPEQKRLLEELVEAARKVPRNQREKFMLISTYDSPQPRLLHPGIPDDHPGAYEGDLDALVNEQLLTQTRASDNTPLYDVAPRGFRYYEHLQLDKGVSVARVERVIRDYVNAAQFQERYPLAYSKWADAEKALWSADSLTSLTTIGHLCREALQEFCGELVANRQVITTSDKSKTVGRLRDVIAATPRLSGSAAAHGQALLAFAGSLIDLVQRQEHGATKEGELLVWSDGRRVVFQTLVTMSELDQELGST
jgi:hypothetical protein